MAIITTTIITVFRIVIDFYRNQLSGEWERCDDYSVVVCLHPSSSYIDGDDMLCCVCPADAVAKYILSSYTQHCMTIRLTEANRSHIERVFRVASNHTKHYIRSLIACNLPSLSSRSSLLFMLRRLDTPVKGVVPRLSRRCRLERARCERAHHI